MMEKISSAQVQTLLKTASSTIRSLQSERDEALAKVAHYEKKARAEKIAVDMEEKGLLSELSMEQKIAHIMSKDMNVTEEAVKMASVQQTLGQLDDNTMGNAGGSAFEQYILTGEAPS